jgi:hypothetical protein
MGAAGPCSHDVGGEIRIQDDEESNRHVFHDVGAAVEIWSAGHGPWLDGASDGQASILTKFENSMVYRVSTK